MAGIPWDFREVGGANVCVCGLALSMKSSLASYVNRFIPVVF
jgi:hypothetical protein